MSAVRLGIVVGETVLIAACLVVALIGVGV